MATINNSSGRDIIIPSSNMTTYRGLGGNDVYIISNVIPSNAKITIVDTGGTNTIQLVDKLIIKSAKFAADSVQLVLSSGATITINGTDNFNFDVGGNYINSIEGIVTDYPGLYDLLYNGKIPTGNNIKSESESTVTLSESDKSEKKFISSEENIGTINYSSQSDYMFPSLSGKYRGLSGDDTYIISSAIQGNIKSSIVDTSGDNIIELVPGLKIISSKFSSNSIRLNLEGGSEITINNADKYIFKLGGNSVIGKSGKKLDYKDLLIEFTGSSTLTTSVVDGKDNYTVEEIDDSSITYSISADKDSITEGDSLTLTLKASSSPSQNVVFTYKIIPSDNNGNVNKIDSDDVDFLSGTIVLRSGKTETDIKIDIIDDKVNEPSEGFSISIKKSDESEIYKEEFTINNLKAIDYVSVNKELSSDFETAIDIYEDTPGLKLIDLKQFNAEKVGIYRWFGEFINTDNQTQEYKDRFDSFFTLDVDSLTLNSRSFFDADILKAGALFNANGSNFSFAFMYPDANSITIQYSTKEQIELGDSFELYTAKIDGGLYNLKIPNLEKGIVLLDLSKIEGEKKSFSISKLTDDKYNFYGVINDWFILDENSLRLADDVEFIKDGSFLTGKEETGLILLGPEGYYNLTGNFYINFSFTVDTKQQFHKVTIEDILDTVSLHKLLINDVIDTVGGFTNVADNYSFNIDETNNKIIESLITTTKHANSLDETSSDTVITFSFPNINNNSLGLYQTGPTKDYYDIYTKEDKLHEIPDFVKDSIREILKNTSEIFKITFVELDSSEYEKSTLRFFSFTNKEDNSTSYAKGPGILASTVVLNKKIWEEGGAGSVIPGSDAYHIIRHEIGHALGLEHPFDDSDGDKASSYFNNTLFTVMAYQSFWDISFDSYKEEIIYSEIVTDIKNDKAVMPPGWQRDDFQALDHLYGVRTYYNSGDNIYKYSQSQAFLETIHDTSGFDTLDVSSFDGETQVLLYPGAVTEIGKNKLKWGTDDSTSGNIIVLSEFTEIEKFIGSKGNDNILLGHGIHSNINYEIISGSGNDSIIFATGEDIIKAGSGNDRIDITLSSSEIISNSININGGAGVDTVEINIEKTSIDIGLCIDAFVGFEKFDFTDNEKQRIKITNDDFFSGLRINGDSIDEVSLPQDAIQTSSDDLYLYYTLNDVEIGISSDLIIV